MAGCLLAMFVLVLTGPLRVQEAGCEELLKGPEQSGVGSTEDTASIETVPLEWIEDILKERELLESLEMLEYMDFFSYSDRFSPHHF